MPVRPDLDEIEVPSEVEEKLSGAPDKELLRDSARFIVFLVGVGLVAIINLLHPYLPVLDKLSTEAIQELSWQIVVLVGILIGARTWRNTKV